MTEHKRTRRWLEALAPRAVIFGFSLGLFVLTCLHDYHLSLMYRPYLGSAENEVATFWLVIASLGLLSRRWWGHLVAVVLGGYILYMPGLLSFWLYATVSLPDGGGPLLSPTTWKGWYQFTLMTQPQYILHALVGTIICVYGLVALTRQAIFRLRRKTI